MNILFLHTRFPWPARSGMEKGRLALLRALQTHHKVTLLVPQPEGTSPEQMNQLRDYCAELIAVPVTRRRLNKRWLWICRWFDLIIRRRPNYLQWEFQSELAECLTRLTTERSFDTIQLCSNYAGAYLPYIQKGKVGFGPIDDLIETARTNGQMTHHWVLKLIAWLHARAYAAFEIPIARRCNRVFFLHQDDLRRFAHMAGGLPQARIMPHPVEPEDPPAFSMNEALAQEKPNTILFVGGLGTSFNIYAVEHFVRDIWPQIRSAIPQARLQLVGTNPSPRIRALSQQPGIDLAADVPDLLPWLRMAAIEVSPVRSGTGFKTKAGEALAYGKPLVAYPEGVQGLWETGPIQIVHSPGEFAQTVIRLLQDTPLRHRLALEARELYLSTYCFAAVAPRTLAVYDEWQNELENEPRHAGSAAT